MEQDIKTERVGHTPGPWTNLEYSTFVHSKHGNVCVCGDPRASKLVGYTETEIGSPALYEAVANARLIAAAPDMLAALKSAEQFLNQINTFTEMACGEHVADLRAAIAKAEGSQQ